MEQKVERQTCQRAALRRLFEVENPYREFLAKKNIITCFNRVLLIEGGGVAVQRGVQGS